MKKILFKGCGTAISTPFDENGVNLKEFERLIEDQIQNKVDAMWYNRRIIYYDY